MYLFALLCYLLFSLKDIEIKYQTTVTSLSETEKALNEAKENQQDSLRVMVLTTQVERLTKELDDKQKECEVSLGFQPMHESYMA